MALPPDFGHWEHLQDTIRREQNKQVKRYFKDLATTGQDWVPNLNTARDKLRVACTHDDKDTAIMALIRLYLFYDVLGFGNKNLGVFYGIPLQEYEESVRYKPQVLLYFSQDKQAVAKDYSPIEAKIRFRLNNETSHTMTEAKAKAIAQEIKLKFLENGKGITFTKGATIFTYKDKEHGLDLQLYCYQRSDAEELIKKCCDLRNTTYHPDRLTEHSPTQKSKNLSMGNEVIYGKPQKKKRWRPTAKVRFRYAFLYVSGLKAPIPLVDLTGNYFNALVH
jgi:hypothetical protein